MKLWMSLPLLLRRDVIGLAFFSTIQLFLDLMGYFSFPSLTRGTPKCFLSNLFLQLISIKSKLNWANIFKNCSTFQCDAINSYTWSYMKFPPATIDNVVWKTMLVRIMDAAVEQLRGRQGLMPEYMPKLQSMVGSSVGVGFWCNLIWRTRNNQRIMSSRPVEVTDILNGIPFDDKREVYLRRGLYLKCLPSLHLMTFLLTFVA